MPLFKFTLNMSGSTDYTIFLDDENVMKCYVMKKITVRYTYCKL